jgi:folate/biopterin transporter
VICRTLRWYCRLFEASFFAPFSWSLASHRHISSFLLFLALSFFISLFIHAMATVTRSLRCFRQRSYLPAVLVLVTACSITISNAFVPRTARLSPYNVASRKRHFRLDIFKKDTIIDEAKINLLPNSTSILSTSYTATKEESSLYEKIKDSLLFGIEPTPEILAIMTIYFVEGALGLARLAQTFLLKDELQLGPAEMSALTGIFALPWTIKPLYGFVSDGFPLFGYRRRSYLILAGMVGSISYFLLGSNFMGFFGKDVLQATIASLLVSSACIAMSDVVADGIVVQRTRDSTDPNVAGGLQSLCWGSAAVGGLLSAYFSGSLLEVMTPRDVFSLTAVLPFLVAFIAFFVNETPNEHNPNEGGMQEQVSTLWSTIKEPSIWKPALFLFLWQSTPTSDGAFLYFMTNDLHMGPEFLGRVRLVTAFAALVGVWVYNTFLKTVSIKNVLFWSSIISFPLGLSTLLLITHANRDLGIPDGAFVFGDDVALAILGQIAFLPTLVLAARLCPPGVEAVLFATLMSIFNGASTLGTEIGAALTKVMGVTESDFSNLGLLTIICNVSSLYPLLFIGWLDGVESQPDEALQDQSLLLPDDESSSIN